MQSRLEAMPVAGHDVVELVGIGAHPELLAPLLNTDLRSVPIHLAEAYRGSSGESSAQADEEVQKLESRVMARRREIEAFRLRYDIVSLERGENEILAQTRDLGTSLSSANERVAMADGKLRALTESAAAGYPAVRSPG